MLLKVTRYDILFQLKQGFYTVYALLTVMYLLILFYLPKTVRFDVTAYIILSDTSIMGLTFVGALILLEKQQNILQVLFITPLKLSHYLWGKALSLTLLAVITSLIIGFVPGGMLGNEAGFITGVILSSLFFTFLGLGVSARVDTLNGYLAAVMLGGLIFVAPLALYFYLPDLSVIFPVNAAVDLLMTNPMDQTIKSVIADISILICWSIIAYLWARRQFLKYIINR